MEVDNPTKVQEYFLAEPLRDLTPVLTPAKMQIIRFTDTVAAALTHCKSKLGYVGGQTYLVLTDTEYKPRVQNQTSAIPTRPTKSTPYDNSKYTRKSWKEFEHKQLIHGECRKYDWQVIALIKRKFPRSLHGLYDEFGHLQLDTTVLMALNKVSDNIVDKSESTRCCQVIRTQMSGRKHTMKANGAEDYFWKTEQDQNMLVRLGSHRVPYHIVIDAATVAFKECGYSKELLGKASIEWEEKVTDGALNLDHENTYTECVDHWNSKLKLIHLYSDSVKGKANKAEDVTQLVEAAVASALIAQASAQLPLKS